MIKGLTIGDRMRLAGYEANKRINGREIRLLTSDVTFVALVNEAASIDPDMPLGSDLREHLTIECRQDEVPTELMDALAKSQVEAECMGEKIMITKREDNPASPFARFEAVKVV